MKKVLLQMHFYLGLCACLFPVVLSLTGAVLVFENELNRAANPNLLKVAPREHQLPWETVRRLVEQQEPQWRAQRL